jgi:flagellar motility protein MotE (MotC chaperone)
MVRSLWTVITVLALTNLLAIAGFVGWLHTSGRINRDRIERVRQVFATTVAQDEAGAQQGEMDAQLAAAAAEEAAKVGTPPLTAEQRLEAGLARDETSSQHAQRVQRETADLIATLLRERAELDRLRAEFDKQVKDFDEMRARIAKEEGTEQFAKTVALYQSLKADQAKAMMQSLIRGGGTDQVVSYLNALPPRTASKIIAEFEKGDSALAADLLERLRMRGNAVAESPPDPAPEG